MPTDLTAFGALLTDPALQTIRMNMLQKGTPLSALARSECAGEEQHTAEHFSRLLSTVKSTDPDLHAARTGARLSQVDYAVFLQAHSANCLPALQIHSIYPNNVNATATMAVHLSDSPVC